MKKRIIALIVIVLFASVCLGLIWSSMNVKSMHNEMENRLITRGYEPKEFKIEISYHWENKLLGYNPYNIIVVYTNEPTVTYAYEYNPKTNEFIQTGVIPQKGKEEKDFKHLE